MFVPVLVLRTTRTAAVFQQNVRQSTAVVSCHPYNNRYVRSARAHVGLIHLLISFAVIVPAACQGSISINSGHRGYTVINIIAAQRCEYTMMMLLEGRRACYF